LTYHARIPGFFSTIDVSVVDSPGGNLILTAAHSLDGRDPAAITFVPGYDNGPAPGMACYPRLCRPALDLIARHRHRQRLRLPLLSSPIQHVTGAETLGTGYAQNQPRVTVTGYPDGSDSP